MSRNHDLRAKSLHTSPMRSGGALMAACILLSAMLCIGQIIGNTVLLLAVLIGILMLIAWACSVEAVMPALMYFLPWSALMKLHSGGTSFFTLGLLLACAYCTLKNRFKVRLYQVIVPAALMMVTLIAKAIQGKSISMEYLFFMTMLVLFPCVTRSLKEGSCFIDISVFFAIGIVTAALSAQYTVRFPNILQYITVESYHSVTRLSGYYGDPNYYSAQISACISCLLIILNDENGKGRQPFLVVLIVILVYCGLLSASKSFAFVMAAIVLVWILIELKRKGKWSSQIRVFFSMVCAAAVIVLSPIFQELFQILDYRFAEASSVSQLTTGRTDIWKEYLVGMLDDPVLLLFGMGYTSVHLFRKASHNSLIQIIYQFGLIGMPLILAWITNFIHGSIPHPFQMKHNGNCLLLLIVGIAAPWLSLDILFFDEFFLLLMLIISGICFLPQNPNCGFDYKTEM